MRSLCSQERRGEEKEEANQSICQSEPEHGKKIKRDTEKIYKKRKDQLPNKTS